MRKRISLILALLMIVSLASIIAVSAATPPDTYPSSHSTPVNDHPVVPVTAGSQIVLGEIIGFEEGWGGNAAAGRDAAFDGDNTTFYDPMGVGNGWVGIQSSTPVTLTEIRILPRINQLPRFNGASIYGWNGGDFNPDTATLIWESMEEADDHRWYVIPASDFKANGAFTHFAYYNAFAHGDVAEVEFYTAAAAAPTPAPEPAQTVETPAPVAEPAPTATPAPAPAVTVTPIAPATGTVGIAFAVAALAVSGFAVTKIKGRK